MIETLSKSTAFEVKPKETAPSYADIYKISDSKYPHWYTPSKTTENQTGDIKITLGSGMESADPKELQEAIKTVQEAVVFIRENAATPAERKTADALEQLLRDGKIIIGDTSCDIGHPVYGYFRPDHDPDTGEKTGCIVLDYDAILAYGKAEAIDTLVHESYHAAQHFARHENDCVEEETRAWNMGLAMSNKYRQQIGEYIARSEPYTQDDIIGFGYPRDLGEGEFTEIVKRHIQEALV